MTYHVVCHDCQFEHLEDDVAVADMKRESHADMGHNVEMQQVQEGLA